MVKTSASPPIIKILILNNCTCNFNNFFIHWRTPNWFVNTGLLRTGHNNGSSPLLHENGRTVRNAEKNKNGQ